MRKSRSKESRNEEHRKLRHQVLLAYGGKCQCCGESNFGFLTLDHVQDKGNEHRTVVGGGQAIYYWAKRMLYPPELRVLCMNCNAGRQWNKGICPHEQERLAA